MGKEVITVIVFYVKASISVQMGGIGSVSGGKRGKTYQKQVETV